MHRDLQNRHVQMIALGGSIGTGLLIGSGASLSKGGPASLIIAWGLVGTMVFVSYMPWVNYVLLFQSMVHSPPTLQDLLTHHGGLLSVGIMPSCGYL